MSKLYFFFALLSFLLALSVIQMVFVFGDCDERRFKDRLGDLSQFLENLNVLGAFSYRLFSENLRNPPNFLPDCFSFLSGTFSSFESKLSS